MEDLVLCIHFHYFIKLYGLRSIKCCFLNQFLLMKKFIYFNNCCLNYFAIFYRVKRPKNLYILTHFLIRLMAHENSITVYSS